MSANRQVLASSGWTPVLFDNLASYSRSEVRLWNWYCRCFSRSADWKTWIQEGVGDLLQTPAGLELGLVQKHAVNRDDPQQNYSFSLPEISIGRDTSSSVPLSTQTAGKRHARIFQHKGAYLIEDLGSPLGTYVNEKKLPPHQPRVLRSGDQFAIFPYVFTVELRQLWTSKAETELAAGESRPASWRSFLDTGPLNRILFNLSVHPSGSQILLEADRSFMAALVQRLFLPLGLDKSANLPLAPDAGAVEFTLLSVVERANRDLAFPFQFDVKACSGFPELDSGTRGVTLPVSVRIMDQTGAFRVFLPFETLAVMEKGVVLRPIQSAVASAVTWELPIVSGYTDLTVEDLSRVEVEDVLLLVKESAVLLPGLSGAGWTFSPAEAGKDDSNIGRVKLDKYFESVMLETTGDANSILQEGASMSAPDLGRMPVRVQAIIGEKEFTLAEVNGLAAGSILDLDTGKSGAVSLAINGRVIGKGQLVELDGRLGVKVLSWEGA